MNGELGLILSDGREIGGFINWSLSVEIRQTASAPMKEYQVESVTAEASSFWLKERMNGTPCDVLFMKDVGGELRAVSRNKMKISLPEEYPLNSIVYHDIGMENG